jgi:hypothetical protein
LLTWDEFRISWRCVKCDAGDPTNVACVNEGVVSDVLLVTVLLVMMLLVMVLLVMVAVVWQSEMTMLLLVVQVTEMMLKQSVLGVNLVQNGL